MWFLNLEHTISHFKKEMNFNETNLWMKPDISIDKSVERFRHKSAMINQDTIFIYGGLDSNNGIV